MMTEGANLPMDNMLSALTDALIADDGNVDHIIARYPVSRAEAEQFLQIIRKLHYVLVGVQPSNRFVQRLKRDLMGETQTAGLIGRVRGLPPRVQIGAGVALIAGFMLLSRRRLGVEARDEVQEAAGMLSV